jgi:CheY-like chemotaxis protein
VAADLWPVSIDVSQFDSSVVNLANNARDAMPGGGQLRIGAQNVHIEARLEEDIVDIRPGSYVRIEVSDSGVGMSADVIERAFEPFFTTKPAGHGTGLGLSMVYGFVTQSGGALRVYSEPGHGTVVRMYLPRVGAADDEGEAGDKQPPSVPPRGHETILVVEDNEAIRRTVVAQLASLGYRVLDAADGGAALRLLEGNAEEVALVFSDVVMPGYPDGHELADLVETRYPGLRVLLTSGFPGDAWSRVGSGGERRTLLSKPYRMDALAFMVRRMLDSNDLPHS